MPVGLWPADHDALGLGRSMDMTLSPSPTQHALHRGVSWNRGQEKVDLAHPAESHHGPSMHKL